MLLDPDGLRLAIPVFSILFGARPPEGPTTAESSIGDGDWQKLTKCGIFTTVVNIHDRVNIELARVLATVGRQILESGASVVLDEDRLHVSGPSGSRDLRLVRLYRPSSADVDRAAASDALLVLCDASRKAARAAASFNHVLVPEGGYRLVLPGVALVHDVVHDVPASPGAVRRARLMGRTGVLAESLLLGGRRDWTVGELAADAGVSPALAHRVLARLEREGLLISEGRGPAKRRTVGNPRALAELWSEEEAQPEIALRGYLYAASTEVLARRILEISPEVVVGATLAANLYKPTLTRVPPPLRLWAPTIFDPDRLEEAGFQRTEEEANVEFLQSRGDAWSVHQVREGVARVSTWRAWLEIARVEGRTRELADALLQELLKA